MNLNFIPEPDMEEFLEIVKKRKKGKRVHICELHIDYEILKEIWEKILGRNWIEGSGKEIQQKMLLNYIEIWKSLGFDAIRLSSSFRFSANIVFPQKLREGDDTAELTKGKRKWVEENTGVIKNWDDFEEYPWSDPKKIDIWPYKFLAENLPDNMGILGCLSQGIFEITMFLFGYENLCYQIYDNPELVKAVVNRVGNIIYSGYKKLLEVKKIIGFFQGDDMGFKTGLLLKPSFFREYILPWHKKFSSLAHENNLIYILHSCGNIDEIMRDLIEDVKIDAKHSFEDEIMPVCEFKRKYGDKIAVIGGVDVGKLTLSKKEEIRNYVQEILEKCGTDGYILGSGNSIANYIPVENFLTMIETGFKYRIKNSL